MTESNKNEIIINMWKIYLNGIVCFLTLGAVAIVGSVVYTVYTYTGGGADDLILLFIGVPMGVLIAVFPFLVNYRNMTRILISDERCVAYSLLGKKICEVDLNEKIYQARFYVRFQFQPERKFVAVSNEPFVCERRQKSLFEKKFYGTYDRKKVIVFPYDEKAASLLRTGDLSGRESVCGKEAEWIAIESGGELYGNLSVKRHEKELHFLRIL